MTTRADSPNGDVAREIREAVEATGPGGLASLLRGLAVLDELAAAPKGRGLNHPTLARRLGMRRSTLYRYLACLQEHGFVEALPDGHTFRLGSRAMMIGTAALRERDFARSARRFVDDLAVATGETAHATMFISGNAVTVELADGLSPIAPRISIGSRRPARCSASGKIFLAHSTEAIVEEALRVEPATITERTIMAPQDFRAELAASRREGYALDRGEYVAGICCMAAPVYDASRAVAGALSVSMVADDWEAQAKLEVRNELLRVASDFTRYLAGLVR